MNVGRKRCDKCRGRGGVYKLIGGIFKVEMFIPCKQCAGRGAWWPNNQKPVKAK
jgi:DnaJ-class molecular chaperone